MDRWTRCTWRWYAIHYWSYRHINPRTTLKFIAPISLIICDVSGFCFTGSNSSLWWLSHHFCRLLLFWPHVTRYILLLLWMDSYTCMDRLLKKQPPALIVIVLLLLSSCPTRYPNNDKVICSTRYWMCTGRGVEELLLLWLPLLLIKVNWKWPLEMLVYDS